MKPGNCLAKEKGGEKGGEGVEAGGEKKQ